MTVNYGRLIDELRDRTSRAHTSLLGPQSPALRAWLNEQLGSVPGSHHGLLGQPVFEHKFGFQQHSETMATLAARGQIHPHLLKQMDRPPPKLTEQRFGRDWFPYTHQVASWNAVRDGKSIVVSAGTGAGKTECFAVPILSDLVGQALDQRSTLTGVQALFLYPLNALINSQRERLSAWTRGLDGKVRYCLYNGETPSTVQASKEKEEPERVMSRKRLRESPPPLLITNATMLEYMLVRPEDAPILQESQGKLKYIVIDEAHTYVGSMAAELALLLRRLMNAFGVTRDQVCFIATSATLSSGGGEADLARFLADISGQPDSRVACITDRRQIPSLPDVPVQPGFPDVKMLEAASEPERFASLAAFAGPRAVRQSLVERNGQLLRDLARHGSTGGTSATEPEILTLLDLGTRARPSPDEEPFLPLRGHLFARALAGLWCCSNPECGGRQGALKAASWPYGRIYTSKQAACADCSSVVFELCLCMQCGHHHLLGELRKELEGDTLVPTAFDEIGLVVDERDDAETSDDEGQGDESSEDTDAGPTTLRDVLFFDLVAEGGADQFDPADGLLGEGPHQARFDEGHHKDRQHTCLRCGYAGRFDRLFARPCRTGRSFMLGVAVPALLQAMPPKEAHCSLPLEGRRTISFTDSRQGTARFAARSQNTAERGFVRSFVYHQLLAESGDPERVAALRATLRTLEESSHALPKGALAPLFESTRAELEKAQGPAAIAIPDMAKKLVVTDDFKHMHTFWQHYLPFKENGISEAQLAEWLILGEFARRPMRAASLETLGLVQVVYDGIDTRRDPPMVWRQLLDNAETAEASWRDFLVLCLDFYVRSNTALAIDNADEFFRWVGSRITGKVVAGPDGIAERNKRVTWPRAGSNSRLEGLLRRALKLNGTDAATKQKINDIFREAWQRLQSQTLFKDMPNRGKALKTAAMQLRLVQDAWLCPITNTLLSTTLLGHSPYAPIGGRELDTRCKPVSMPVAPVTWGRRFAPVDTIRARLADDPTFQNAKALGAISEFTERIFEHVEYWQTAEHSAQITSRALQAAERDFRAGKLNLLSCSTTMEMGVDIGNLSGVAMNNVPPSPANFLQRVGRAGRRGEAAAVSLTVCRQLPHDQAVFKQPDWPFRTAMQVTPVKLDSHPIVSRHLRAALLTAYLARVASETAAFRLTCRWFFVGPGPDEASVCDRLCEWLAHPSTATELASSLLHLVNNSALHGQAIETLLASAVPVFQDLAQDFHRVRDALLEQLHSLPEAEQETSAPALLFRRELSRHDEEYLLSYLADQQVLPGYGFPSGVIPFVHTTSEELDALKRDMERWKQQRKQGEPEDFEAARTRIDSRARLTGLATRDLPVAIREYAPGAKLVIDRRSYTSKGVRLSWKVPASANQADTREIQALRRAWSCRACGAAGTVQISEHMTRCPSCGEDLPERGQRDYLQPAGFTTDFHDKATLDAPGTEYLPVVEPWIASGVGPFRDIGVNTPLVRWRHAANGEIVYLAAGPANQGYALCLRCGRAEPETSDPDLPRAMQDHRKLRSGKVCEGNDEGSYAIKRHLRLGGSLRTDVLELWLMDPTTGQFACDMAVLSTVAVALRKVSAQHIGVDEREIGWRLSHRSRDGQPFHAIMLYDTASGGAGFVAQLPTSLPHLLRQAAATCHSCPAGCDRVCHACLLSSDTQHRVDLLDRRLVQSDGDGLLSQRYLDALEPDLSAGPFGALTRPVWTDPVERVAAHVQREAREGDVRVALMVGGTPSSWDLATWTGRDLLRRFQGLGANVRVTLVLEQRAVDALDWQMGHQLKAVCALFDATVAQVDTLPAWWCEVTGPNGTQAWASDGEAPMDDGWPRVGRPHMTGPAHPTVWAPVDFAAVLKPPPARLHHVDLASACHGTVRDAGRNLLQAFAQGTPLLEVLNERGPADVIEVNDRYLKSPFVVTVLYRLLEALRQESACAVDTPVQVRTLAASNDRVPRIPSHNWGSAQDHAEVIKLVLSSLSQHVRLHTELHPYELPHARTITLCWGTDRLELRLDEGFGFLRGKPDRFPFGEDVTAQVNAILKARWPLEKRRTDRVVPGYLLMPEAT